MITIRKKRGYCLITKVKMKKLICHCGAIEAEINIESFEKLLDAIAQFVKERSNHVYGQKVILKLKKKIN